jgi:hypothetical protein
MRLREVAKKQSSSSGWASGRSFVWLIELEIIMGAINLFRARTGWLVASN